MEKYKKKLQEGADLRQHVKVGTYSFFVPNYASKEMSFRL